MLGLAGALAAPAATHANASSAGPSGAPLGVSMTSDFNGDGIPDLAMGVPNAGGGAGAVSVLYGSSLGLTTTGSQWWTLATTVGVRSTASDQFGFSLTTGDFNGDGYADLAIGVPGRSAVVVLYGSHRGLRERNSQMLHVGGPLGALSIASGDFNGDGVADLAVGDPYASAGSVGAAGVVEVRYGSTTGFPTGDPTRVVRFSETKFEQLGMNPRSSDKFGTAVAAGDFNGDGFADLAIAIPGNGDAVALFGSADGVKPAHAQVMPSWGTGGPATLATGDFNGDGYTDLAVGEPDASTSFGSGMVEVHYGGTDGLGNVALGTAQLFAQQTVGMPGPQLYEDDRFGYALAAADFNGDGYADLAVGVPGLSAAIVLNGSSSHVRVSHARFVEGVGPQVSSTLSATGIALAGAQFRGARYADLIVGEPFADTSQAEAGVLEVHNGSTAGVTALQQGSAPELSADTAGIAGGPSVAGELLGFSLAAA